MELPLEMSWNRRNGGFVNTGSPPGSISVCGGLIPTLSPSHFPLIQLMEGLSLLLPCQRCRPGSASCARPKSLSEPAPRLRLLLRARLILPCICSWCNSRRNGAARGGGQCVSRSCAIFIPAGNEHSPGNQTQSWCPEKPLQGKFHWKVRFLDRCSSEL